MPIITKTTTTESELTMILAGALERCRDSKLSEVCTESLLYAIMDNESLAANTRLLKIGFNIYMFKRTLLKRLQAKVDTNPPAMPVLSVAVEGLLVLNSMDRRCSQSSLHLLRTIIKNNNTAAARLLKKERIFLNEFNELIYKPISE